MLSGHYFVMDGCIDVNLCLFWKTFVIFLKSSVLRFFRNIAKVMLIWMAKVGQNLITHKKTGLF